MSLGLMPRLQSFRFHYGLDMIIAAYRGSTEGPTTEKTRAQKLLKVWEGSAEYDEHPDPEGYSSHLAGIHDEAEDALRLIREAFAITLFHFWERQAKGWAGAGSHYDHAKITGKLKERGYAPDEGQLELLQLVANVAKHSAGSSARKLYRVRKELFRDPRRSGTPYIGHGDGEEPPYEPVYDDLLVSEPLIESFFEAVRRSGPRKTPLTF